jgi:hypothetical protein
LKGNMKSKNPDIENFLITSNLSIYRKDWATMHSPIFLARWNTEADVFYNFVKELKDTIFENSDVKEPLIMTSNEDKYELEVIKYKVWGNCYFVYNGKESPIFNDFEELKEYAKNEEWFYINDNSFNSWFENRWIKKGKILRSSNNDFIYIPF